VNRYFLRSVTMCLLGALAACGVAGNGNNKGGGGSQSVATHFYVTTPQDATAGTSFNFTVTALDRSNAVVPSYAGTIHFASTDSKAELPADSTLTNGAGIFSVILNASGNQTITVTDTTQSITGVSKVIQVSGLVAAGTFTPTGSLQSARAGHTATLLKDGTVLIIGGEDATGPLATAEIFNPSTGAFTLTPGSMQTARAGHTATLLADGTVLLIGGSNATAALASGEIYNPASGTFTLTTGSMETPRAGHTATLLNDGTGRVLIAGGGTATEEFFGAGLDGSTASAELFDPKSGQFTPVGDMSTGRIYHVASLLPNGDVLLAGGTDTANLSGPSQGDLFQPASATFTATGIGGITALHLPAPLLYNGMVLLSGGEVSASPCGAGGSLISSAEAMLFKSDESFSQISNMSASRIGHSATLLTSGEVLVGGGAVSHTPCNRGYGTSTFQSISSAEIFDPAAGTFTPTGSMETARAGHTATLLGNGKVLVVGGIDANGNALASAELFQ